jgi:hypothetical protein
MRRYPEIKQQLSDPTKRRLLIARGTVATQAREGIDITLEEALTSYDYIKQKAQNPLPQSVTYSILSSL